MKKPILLIAIALCLSSALSALTNEFREESNLETVASFLTKDYLLTMPFFISSAEQVSLYALRNVSNSAVTVRTTIILADGRVFTRNDSLSGKQTLTVNVADLQLPVVEQGSSFGYVGFTVIDPSTGDALPGSRVLSGDYFIVDPFNNFATGGSLLGGNQTCSSWSTRFADGGVFDGTTFYFFAVDPNLGSLSLRTLFDFKIYDEAGNLTDQGSLQTDSVAVTLNTADLKAAGLNIPTFGSIEWTFRTNVGPVYAFFDMSASGKFSVGSAGTCID